MTLLSTDSMGRHAGQLQCPFTVELNGWDRLCNQPDGHTGPHTFNGTNKKVTTKGT